MKKFFIVTTIASLLFLLSLDMFAEEGFKLNFSAYTDSYISLDGDRIKKNWEETGALRQFTYINAKKDQLDLNIAQISGTFDFNSIVRGKLTLQQGTLVETAYGGFPVQEAYMGFSPASGFWIDAGYYLTHIGGESFLPKDNWLSSHSIVTYFEPFYHAGVKASYSNDKFTASLHVCNGNGILKENNDNKSVGMFLLYKPSEKISFSYANILGNEEAGATTNGKMHQLHNLCLNFNPFRALELKAQFDGALKEKVKLVDDQLESGFYYGFSVQGRYTILPKLKCSARYSMFDDNEAVYATGLSGMEASAGIEYAPLKSSYVRLEASYLAFTDASNADPKKFTLKDGTNCNQRVAINLNFGIWMD